MKEDFLKLLKRKKRYNIQIFTELILLNPINLKRAQDTNKFQINNFVGFVMDGYNTHFSGKEMKIQYFYILNVKTMKEDIWGLIKVWIELYQCKRCFTFLLLKKMNKE